MAKQFGNSKVIREQGPLLAIIALLFLIFGLQTILGPAWYQAAMTVPRAIAETWNHLLAGDFAEAEIWRFGTLLSSAFLHGSFQHIVFNVIFLWIFGALTAEILGHRWMIGVFAISAIAGSLAHTLLDPSDPIPMLGASGAVMGFMGAYLGMALRWHLPDPHIWPMSRPVPPANLAALAVIGIVLDFMGIVGSPQSGIAYGAHIGGFVAGMFLTSFVVPKPKNLSY